MKLSLLIEDFFFFSLKCTKQAPKSLLCTLIFQSNGFSALQFNPRVKTKFFDDHSFSPNTQENKETRKFTNSG